MQLVIVQCAVTVISELDEGYLAVSCVLVGAFIGLSIFNYLMWLVSSSESCGRIKMKTEDLTWKDIILKRYSTYKQVKGPIKKHFGW